jgi:hypothetical protein
MSLFWRLGLLVLLMAVIAWIDWRRHGVSASKWREYAFLIAAGLLGSLFGMTLDNLTATVSPDFFVYGKGIAIGDGFRGRVTYVGFHAGLLAGVIVGGVYLLANNKRPDRKSLPFLQLFRFALWPILVAVLLMPLVASLMYSFDPLGVGKGVDFLSPSQQRWFLAVWGINVGGYLGGLLGTIRGVVGIRKTRAATPQDTPL